MSQFLPLSRRWVNEHYGKQAVHLLTTEEWLRRLHPLASEALLLATLTHDYEARPHHTGERTELENVPAPSCGRDLGL